MTPVHANLSPTRLRADEGAALQRRLLQDLERQWLDSWGVADQLQAQAAPPPATPAEDAAKPDAGLPPTALAQGDAAPAQGVAAAHAPPHAAPCAAAKLQASAPAHAGAPRATQLRQPAPTTTSTATPSPGPGQPRAAAPAEAAPAPAVTRDASAPGLDTGAPLQRPLDEPRSRAALPLVAGAGATPAMAASTRTGETPPTQVDAAAPRAKLGTGPASLGALAQPPAAEGEAAESEPLAAPTRTPPRSPEAEPGPRHFMLRELNDQEVLATMRDADLGGAQSQQAAEGLARALMEAGYARVQVVVNGQRQERSNTTAQPLADAPGAQSARRATAEPLSPLNSQESRHGH